MSRLAARQLARGINMEIPAPAVPARARLPDQQQQGVHPLAIPVARKVPDAVLRPVGSDIVAVDDQNRVAAKLRQRLDHAAADIEPPPASLSAPRRYPPKIRSASFRERVCQYV